MSSFAIVFSKPQDRLDPFDNLGEKRPVYEELLSKIASNGVTPCVVTTKSYLGDGRFSGYWELRGDNFVVKNGEVKIDIAYDRSGGLGFPLKGDSLKVIDTREFKILAWNKWKAYKEIPKYMVPTFWVGRPSNLKNVLKKIKSDWIVVKPVNGLKGKNIYIGKKEGVKKELVNGLNYIAQTFIDTSGGIKGITEGNHDLRVVIINGKPVWSHVRVPAKGTYEANVAAGGSLEEIPTNDLPEKVLGICKKIAPLFLTKYDNPVYSLDFGIDENGVPHIFEINDQIGFPKAGMQAKNKFLDELTYNILGKIKK